MQSYQHPTIGTDKTGLFGCLALKLVVINALLHKPNSFSDRLEKMSQKYVEKYEYFSFHCIPEMVSFFETLKLTEEDLAMVTELNFDAGIEIFNFIMPDWDGESDEFEVYTFTGIEKLPNLKQMKYMSLCTPGLVQKWKNSNRLSAIDITE